MSIKNLITSLLHNNYCIICQIEQIKSSSQICTFCYSILPWLNKNYRCNKCLAILTNKSDLICADCRNQPPDFNKIFSIFEYSPPIKYLLLALKFNQKLAYAKFLSNILLEQVKNLWYLNATLPEAIIPVPLHIDRLRSRGFNQALELAKSLKLISIVDPNCCIRTKNTISQTELSVQKRKTNIKHAFTAKIIPYQHVAILDDIVTTASTIKNLATAIKQVNPNIRIDIWTIART